MLRKSLIALIVATSFACGGSTPSGPDPGPGGSSSSGSGSSGSPTAPGTLNVRITDSPYGNAGAILITFSEVAVQRGTSWTRVSFPGGASTWTCDLKKLYRVEDVLATGTPGVAVYTMVRLTIQSAKIFLDNAAVSATPCARSIAEPAGAAYAMNIANTQPQENGSFPVTSSGVTTILLDLDGDSSVIQNGPGVFTLNPVLRLVSVS